MYDFFDVQHSKCKPICIQRDVLKREFELLQNLKKRSNYLMQHGSSRKKHFQDKMIYSVTIMGSVGGGGSLKLTFIVLISHTFI